MKFFYPKFLKVGPKFIGLTLLDLFFLVCALLLSLILNLSSFQSLAIISLLIGVSKVVTLKFPRGYFQFYFHKRSALNWRDEILKLTNGVFI